MEYPGKHYKELFLQICACSEFIWGCSFRQGFTVCICGRRSLSTCLFTLAPLQSCLTSFVQCFVSWLLLSEQKSRKVRKALIKRNLFVSKGPCLTQKVTLSTQISLFWALSPKVPVGQRQLVCSAVAQLINICLSGEGLLCVMQTFSTLPKGFL